MNKLKFLVAAAFMVAMSVVSQAQTAAPLKIGYTNVDYILASIPESKQIESDLKAHSTQLENQLQSKAKEFETKGAAYQKAAATMTDVVRADKEKELMNMRSSIEEFQKNAELSLQKKQQSLLDPVYKKIQQNIDAVAKENGYTYVFNSDAGYGASILLYAPEENNISDLVLKKMGVTPPAKGAASAPAASPSVNNAKPATTTPPAKATAKKKK